MVNARASRELEQLSRVCNELSGKVAGVTRNYRGIPTRGDIRRAMEQIQLAIDLLDRQIGEPLPTTPGGLRRVVSGLTSRLLKPSEQEPESTDTTTEPQQVAVGTSRNVPMTGNTSSIPLPSLLFFLQEHAKTGALNLVTDREVFTVEIENGDLVHAGSDNSPEGCRLGEILVEQGFLDAKNLNALVTKYSRQPGHLGEALSRGEIVSPEQLRAALEHQIQDLFDRLLQADNAYFHFTEGQLNSSDGRVRMNITKLLMECVRRQEDGPR